MMGVPVRTTRQKGAQLNSIQEETQVFGQDILGSALVVTNGQCVVMGFQNACFAKNDNSLTKNKNMTDMKNDNTLTKS